jgi:LacI family transcriptional regulator
MPFKTTAAPTIRSLAKSLGCGRTTVSDALRGAPGVSAATVLRVRTAATKAGYLLNPLESAIMSQMRRARGKRWFGVIAAVDFEESERPASARVYHARLLAGAQQRAAELGFDISYFAVGEHGVSVPRLNAILRSRGIEGVLLLPMWKEPDFSKLDWSRYAGIYTDYVIKRPALHSVCPDHQRAMVEVLERVIGLGYQRPGLFIQRHADARLQHRWMGAFLGNLRLRPEVKRVPPLIAEPLTEAHFKRWFRRHRPDVVLGHLPQAIEWMEQCGARIPATHGFVSLNLTADFRPCAGRDLKPGLIGACAAEMLIAQLQRNERGIPQSPLTTLVPGCWVEGPSLRAHRS